MSCDLVSKQGVQGGDQYFHQELLDRKHREVLDHHHGTNFLDPQIFCQTRIVSSAIHLLYNHSDSKTFIQHQSSHLFDIFVRF